jgi:streptogramin lyase
MRRAVRLKRIGSVVAGLLLVTIPATKGEAQSVSSAAAATTEYVVDTFVGPSSSSVADSAIGDLDGFRQTARVNIPNEFGFDARGNTYFTDPQVFKVKIISPEGIVSTLAGSTQGSVDGVGSSAKFEYPASIAVDPLGNVYVADQNKIRKISTEGVVSTIAGDTEIGNVDGLGPAARFRYTGSITLDRNGDLLVIDRGNSSIRRVTVGGQVTTDRRISTEGNNFNSLRVDSSGNLLVLVTTGAIYRIAPSGDLVTVAGLDDVENSSSVLPIDGQGQNARFGVLGGMTIGAEGSLFVAEYGSRLIRKVSPSGNVTTIAGVFDLRSAQNGVGNVASFIAVSGIGVAPDGSIFVGDYGRIRRLRPNVASNSNVTLTGKIKRLPAVVGSTDRRYTVTLDAADLTLNLPITFRILTGQQPGVALTDSSAEAFDIGPGMRSVRPPGSTARWEFVLTNPRGRFKAQLFVDANRDGVADDASTIKELVIQ